jgi:hypothetical protein
MLSEGSTATRILRVTHDMTAAGGDDGLVGRDHTHVGAAERQP